MLKNDRILRAIRREPLDRTPMWIMRQAGRYLPEYRAVRAKAGSFMTLCKTPELACEVTMQPLRRYPLDAAIIFSDILTIPDAMGLDLQFVEGEGPIFRHPVQNAEQIARLQVPPHESLNYVYEAIRLTQDALAQSVPLIGFTGSPWTLAAYMIEGRGKTLFPKAMQMLQTAPLLLHQLLNLLMNAVYQHLVAQIEAGVQVVMIFDTWGGLLSTENYQAFSLHYIREMLTKLKKTHPQTPVIAFTKDGSQWLKLIAESGCDVVGLDWHIHLREAREQVGHKVVLQGNLDPAIMQTSSNHIRAAVKTLLASFGHGSGHIFNLGHGITPTVPPEHVHVLIDSVHEMSKSYHA